jgi:hypothetical protein
MEYQFMAANGMRRCQQAPPSHQRNMQRDRSIPTRSAPDVPLLACCPRLPLLRAVHVLGQCQCCRCLANGHRHHWHHVCCQMMAHIRYQTAAAAAVPGVLPGAAGRRVRPGLQACRHPQHHRGSAECHLRSARNEAAHIRSGWVHT